MPHPPPPPPPHLHPQYARPAYLAGTTAPGSMRIDFRTPRIEAYAGGNSARLASASNKTYNNNNNIKIYIALSFQ